MSGGGIDAGIIRKLLEEIYASKDPDKKALFKETAKRLIGGVIKGYGKDFPKLKFNSPDYELLNELTYNAGTFAAFKNHSQIKESIKLLKDADGNLRSKSDFIKEAKKLDATYNKRYLGVEYDQAVTAGRMSRKWQDAKRGQNLYPNLTYVAVMDDRTRPLHRKWHGVTLPIDHKFWDTHYPPNDWACRCTIRRTDKAVDEKGLKTEDMPKLPKQFNINIGKQGKVFEESHPYFKASGFEKVATYAKHALIGYGRERLKGYLKTNEIGKKRFSSQLGKVRVNTKKMMTTSSDREYLKINLLYNLKEVLKQAVYATSGPDSKQNPMVRVYHYLFIEVAGKPMYLNVREMKGGELVLYTITDNLKK